MVLRQVAFGKNVEGWQTTKWPTPRFVAITSSLIPASAAQPDLCPLERAASASLRPTRDLFDKQRYLRQYELDNSRHLEFRAIVGILAGQLKPLQRSTPRLISIIPYKVPQLPTRDTYLIC